MKTYHKFTEQQDNIICTFVKLYRFNVGYGLKRASEYTGIRRSIIVSRYYKHLRNSKEIFSVNFGDKIIWNTRSMSSKDLDELRKFEKLPKDIKFEDLQDRAWWNK